MEFEKWKWKLFFEYKTISGAYWSCFWCVWSGSICILWEEEGLYPANWIIMLWGKTGPLSSRIIAIKGKATDWLTPASGDEKSTSVQVMAWCLMAPSHYLSQCWPSSISWSLLGLVVRSLQNNLWSFMLVFLKVHVWQVSPHQLYLSGMNWFKSFSTQGAVKSECVKYDGAINVKYDIPISQMSVQLCCGEWFHCID